MQGYTHDFYASVATSGQGVLSIECEAAEYEVWRDDDIEVRLGSIKVGPRILTRADLARLFGEHTVREAEQAVSQHIIDLGGFEVVFPRDDA
jgi:hypothetical protein